MKRHFLILTDSIIGGISLAYSMGIKLSRNILWFSSEHPSILREIIESYNEKPNLIVVNSRDMNLANLNEINIRLSKFIDSKPINPAIIISMISELILIHDLEKTYLFIDNFIKKVELVGGTIIGVMMEGAQEKRDEILISKLFPVTLILKSEKTENDLAFNLETQFPINGKFNFKLNTSNLKVELPPELEKAILKQV